MRNLIKSIKNFYKYPSREANLGSFFRYEGLQKKFEFCPKGHTCDILESDKLHNGDYPPTKCDDCIKNYINDSDLDAEYKEFLYARFSSKKGPQDNSWIMIEEDMSEEDPKSQDK